MNILPVEIIDEVLWRVLPGDIIRLSSSSRWISSIAQNSKLLEIFKFNSAFKIIKWLVKTEHDHWLDWFISTTDEQILNSGMINAAKLNNMKYVEKFIEAGADDWGEGLVYSACEGHIDMMEFFIQKGASRYSNAAYGAAENGQINAFDLIYDAYDPNISLNACLSGAAASGQLNMMKHLIDLGADSLNKALWCSVGEDYRDCVNYLLELGVNDWNWGLIRSARLGECNILKFYLEKGADAYDEALEAYLDYEDNNACIVHTLLDAGATDMVIVMLCAIKLEDFILMDSCIEQGYHGWNVAMIHAIINNNYILTEYFLLKGADDYDAGLNFAMNTGNKRILKLLVEFGAENYDPENLEEIDFEMLTYLEELLNNT